MNYKTLLAKPAVALAALAALGGGAGVAALASADTATTSTTSTTSSTQNAAMAGPDRAMGGIGMGHMGPGMGRGAMGTVSAVSGNTLTITGDNGTTYTIDAGNATVSKIVTESVSDIQVGDRIDAQGSVSGSTVTADHIMAGIPTHPTPPPTPTTAQ